MAAISPHSRNLVPEFGARHQHVEMAALLSLLVIVKHHANIRRLLTRAEPKIGDKAD